MRVNNVNNQPNFGIGHVGAISPNKEFMNLVKSAEVEIRAIGHPDSICEIFDQEFFPRLGQVCVMVIAKDANDLTIGGQGKGIAKTKEALLDLVREANNQLNQRFFDKSHAQITAKPEIDSVTGRPKLGLVK